MKPPLVAAILFLAFALLSLSGCIPIRALSPAERATRLRDAGFCQDFAGHWRECQ